MKAIDDAIDNYKRRMRNNLISDETIPVVTGRLLQSSIDTNAKSFSAGGKFHVEYGFDTPYAAKVNELRGFYDPEMAKRMVMEEMRYSLIKNGYKVTL